MKEHLTLRSEDELCQYVRRFLQTNPKALQLDGSIKPHVNNKVVVVFEFSIDHQRYKLAGDTTRQALEEFVRLAEEHGDASLALKEYTPQGRKPTLILSTHESPGGWHCQPFVAKASEKLKRAA